MQLVTLKIDDSLMGQFLNYIDSLPKNKVEVLQNTLGIEIEKRIDEIESGRENPLPLREGLEQIKAKIIHKYANR
jgi:hypothetical protein